MLIDAIKRAFKPRPIQVVMAVGAFAAVVFIVRFAAVNSEVYEFADDFVAKDMRIASLTGRQDERALRWFKGFSMSYGDNSGEAALTMRVAGERGAFDVPLSLKKSQGRWSVVYARAINEEGEAVVIVCHVLAVAPDTEGRIVGDEVFGRRDGLSFFLDAHRVSDGQDPRLFAGEEAVLRRGQVANLTG